MAERVGLLLAGIWAGALICLAALVAPTVFSLLPPADAGGLMSRLLTHEAQASLALAAVLLLVERGAARRRALAGGSQFSAGMALALGALFCTIVGHFVLQPMMAEARIQPAKPTFAQLHALSMGFYAVKLALVLALAWRGGRAISRPTGPPTCA